jgi:hypothetical protein
MVSVYAKSARTNKIDLLYIKCSSLLFLTKKRGREKNPGFLKEKKLNEPSQKRNFFLTLHYIHIWEIFFQLKMKNV